MDVIMVLASAGKVGHGVAIVVGPVVLVVALLTWLTLTRLISRNPRTPGEFHDQDNHRGPEQGGYYVRRRGAYSHSYAENERPEYNDENR